MRLKVLESYDLGVMVRAADDEVLLLIGPAARHCLRASHTSIVSRRPDTPLAVIGLPEAVAPPRTLPHAALFPAVGRAWYLVDEHEAREAYGDDGPALGIAPPEPILWPSGDGLVDDRTDGPRGASAYYEEPE